MYVIKSPRLGTPGEPYDYEKAAAAGVNVEALISGGFIEKASTKPAKKNAKVPAEEPAKE